jgi:hypothetical protein
MAHPVQKIATTAGVSKRIEPFDNFFIPHQGEPPRHDPA